MAQKEPIKNFVLHDRHGHEIDSSSFSVVSGVSVTFHAGVGEPYCESRYQGGILYLDFYNIKGEGITDITYDESQEDAGTNYIHVTTDGGNEYDFPVRNGSRGNGITSIDTVESQEDGDYNIVRIHCTDDESVDGTVLRIKNGKRGNGIASVTEELSDQDGGINTHTITDDDGHTHTIHTRNGQTGLQGIQGPQGNSGYQGAAGELQIVNNLTDGGAAAGLSAEMGKALSANIAYAVCSTEGATSAKTVSIAGYAIKTGGCLIIKMTNKTTANASLNINSAGARYLFYNGAQANASNTWKDEETLIVFYDGTRYQSYNIQGGSAESKYFLNVNQITDNVYTLATAIPVALAYMQGNFIPRIKGFIITYKTGATNNVSDWEIALYNYDGSLNDANFAKKNNWKILPDFSSVISEVKYKGAILNLNLFNDTVYTLTSAIAAAYDLMGARRGLIIMFKTDSSEKFAYYRYTYAYTLNESNFKNEAYWVNWESEIKAKTPIELIEEQGNFTGITSSATYVAGVILNNHTEESTEKSNVGIYTCPVKGKHKYKMACGVSIQMQQLLERFCFYDSAGSAIVPIDGTSYAFTESIGYKIYELTAPVGAATLKVIHYNTDAMPFAIYEQADYNLENSEIRQTNKDSVSAVAKILDVTGEIADPIEIKNGYKIDYYNKIVEDSRVNLYVFPNGYYHAERGGHSQSIGIAAFDEEWNPVEVIAGSGNYFNIDVYPVLGAKYIVFAWGVDAGIRILQSEFLPKCIVPFHEDNPIPVKTSGLKILNLGNSFSQDTFFRIRYFINQANIQDCTIACGRFPGGTIEDWYNRIPQPQDSEGIVYEVYSNADFPSQHNGYTLDDLLLEEDWDIIILQQRSAKADSFGSFFPYITELMSYIKEKVRNRRLCFMFNMVWASEGTYDSANKQHYNDIVNITKRMCAEVGITHVIPTGVGIQYGRQTDIETPMNWTRDALHLDLGAGRYLAAATAFQYIFGYTNGVDVRDYNAFRYTPGEGEVATAVTEENIDILNQCAADAVNNRFMLEEL